jgi:hypothetical protein
VKQSDGEDEAGAERIPFPVYFTTLLLGWSPTVAWEATPAEITEAYRGKRELLAAMFGGGNSQ